MSSLRTKIAPWSNSGNLRYCLIRMIDYWKYRFDDAAMRLERFTPRCHYCGGRLGLSFTGWRPVKLLLHGKTYRFHFRCFQFCFEQKSATMKQ